VYPAKVVKVMIASPGDVAAERLGVRDAVHEWNAVHSEDKRVVLLPVGWETHGQPTMGDRPQAVINKQILRGCDVLVAVFWTRLGSPTGVFPSGTVEEMDEHVKAGKQAMVYFSSAPVRPDSVDDVQYKALLQFRSDCQNRGLIETYDSLGEFRDKFDRQLAQLVIRDFSAETEVEGRAGPAEQIRRAVAPVLNALSSEARELLLEGAEDKNGTVMRILTMGGLGIQTNGRQFAERGDPRSEARWDGGLRQLRELGLLEDMGHKGELFRLTDKGYQAADMLRGGIGAA
jgi:hypothetical protein